jgi:uncharacterized protein YkwD
LRPIAWNDKIAQGAQDHANICKIEHSQGKNRKHNSTILGENLAYGTYGFYDDQQMVGMWEKEKEYYIHPEKVGKKRPKGQTTGHYTQIVNKNVNEIGCGCAKCGDNKYCVCRYSPIQLSNEVPY